MTNTLVRETVRETGPVGLVSTRPGRLLVQLITPGWGSSGYYSEDTLKEAVKAGIWAAGHHMFLDHPGEEENYDRPERSVRDLSATLTEAARWDDALKAVVAEAQPFGPWAETLRDEDFARAIGVSIRAYAEGAPGEAEGRHGTIITRLTEAISTDFVTVAGRGGAILAVLESARPLQVVARAVAHGVAEATANDTRRALQTALADAYGGEHVWLWVRDFDAATVWFDYETDGASAIYQQGYTMSGELSITLSDNDPIEVLARTVYTPVSQTESKNLLGQPGRRTETEREAPVAQIDESRLATLEAAAARVTALEADVAAITARAEAAETRAAAAEARESAATVRENARPAVTRAFNESAIPTRRAGRLIESILRGVTADTTPEALQAAVAQTIKDEEADLAELSETVGAGRVAGFGSTATESASVEAFDAAFKIGG